LSGLFCVQGRRVSEGEGKDLRLRQACQGEGTVRRLLDAPEASDVAAGDQASKAGRRQCLAESAAPEGSGEISRTRARRLSEKHRGRQASRKTPQGQETGRAGHLFQGPAQGTHRVLRGTLLHLRRAWN